MPSMSKYVPKFGPHRSNLCSNHRLTSSLPSNIVLDRTICLLPCRSLLHSSRRSTLFLLLPNLRRKTHSTRLSLFHRLRCDLMGTGDVVVREQRRDDPAGDVQLDEVHLPRLEPVDRSPDAAVAQYISRVSLRSYLFSTSAGACISDSLPAKIYHIRVQISLPLFHIFG